MPKPKPYNKRDSKPYKEKLLAIRARLRGDVSAVADAALRRTHSEANRDSFALPIYDADAAADDFEREFTLTLTESEEDTLGLVIEALERIEEGAYGICTECGSRIPKARLNAIPYAPLCIQCAREIEADRSVAPPTRDDKPKAQAPKNAPAVEVSHPRSEVLFRRAGVKPPAFSSRDVARYVSGIADAELARRIEVAAGADRELAARILLAQFAADDSDSDSSPDSQFEDAITHSGGSQVGSVYRVLLQKYGGYAKSLFRWELRGIDQHIEFVPFMERVVERLIEHNRECDARLHGDGKQFLTTVLEEGFELLEKSVEAVVERQVGKRGSLVIARREGEEVHIGNLIAVRIDRIHNNSVVLALDVPDAFIVAREELPLQRPKSSGTTIQHGPIARPQKYAIVVSRSKNDSLLIGGVRVTVADIRGRKVTLAINAPRKLSIRIREFTEEIKSTEQDMMIEARAIALAFERHYYAQQKRCISSCVECELSFTETPDQLEASVIERLVIHAESAHANMARQKS